MTGNWNKLTLASDREAKLATEYGDGTTFKKGDTVWHNHVTGRYARMTELVEL